MVEVNKTQQQEDVQTVGEMLRNARLKRSETVSEIADKLYIRKQYITAIEEMDYANIPPVPYGVGFIRSYAKYLGLNEDRIISSYRQFMTEENSANKTVSQENIETSKPHFKHIVIGICGLVALFVAWSVMPLSEPIEDFNENAADVIPEPVIAEEDANEKTIEDINAENVKDGEISADNEQTPLETNTVPENQTLMEKTEESAEEQNNTDLADKTPLEDQTATDEKSLKIVVTGPTWLELKQGNTNLFVSKVYDNGFEFNIPNQKGLRITVGRPHNVKFMLNGQEIPVVSVMKRKNVKLDEFLPKEEE